MGRREQLVEKVGQLMLKREDIRNLGIVAHIDHGKTTISDSLIAASGVISEDLAGKQLYLDSDEQEQARGITIDAANISMVTQYGGKDYLINMIDTPGHVDFGGDVTRAMRAVDGVVVVVCAVEGCMPQTETVIRQALRERVRPVLFINKVDRLINELQVTPEQMQERFVKIISKVNGFIEKLAPEEHKKDWQVSAERGTVAFGSGYHKWAVSIPAMKRNNITFTQVYDHLKNQQQKELSKKAKLHEVVFEMVVKNLPNPLDAQKYRIEKIWRGDINSEIGQSMAKCDPDGKLVVMVTKMIVDPHAGAVATGRVYSGTVKKGTAVQLVNTRTGGAIQQVSIYMGPERVQVESVPAGNMVAIVGLKDASSGETICVEDIEPFEAIKHYSEPVITKSIEAKNPKDLPKLIEVLRQVSKADPTIKVEINEETGEHLISGMGELHLEIVEYRIKRDKSLEVQTGPPIVVYRETVKQKSQEVEGKSPNKHNRFFFTAEPLEPAVFNAIKEGEISEGRVKPKELAEKLRELGVDTKEAKNYWNICNGCVLVDASKGVQYLNECKELLQDSFEAVVNGGPLAEEKCIGLKISLLDAKLHEDAVHRGPAQVYPAARNPMKAAILLAKDVLMEPKQKLFVNVPEEFMGNVSKEIQSRRGQLLNMSQEADAMEIEAKVPVAEMFGFASAIRSATQGRCLWSTEYLGYEQVPPDLQTDVVRKIRQRKGLKPEPLQPADYMER